MARRRPSQLPLDPLPAKAFQAGLERVPDGVLAASEDGRIHFANAAIARLLGTSQASLPGTHLSAWVPDDWWMDWRIPVLETLLPTKDGDRVPVELTRTWVPRPVGRELFLYVHDLTARRAAESALRRSEYRYAMAFNASPDSINLTRLEDGTYLEVSEGFTRMSGWSRDEALGRTSVELGIWAEPEERRQMTARLRAAGEFDGFRYTFRHKTGRLLQGLMSGRIVSLEGTPCLLTVTRDITRQVEAERALGDLTQLMTSIMSSVQAYITLLDRRGRIRFLNRIAEGFSAEDVQGLDFREGLDAEARILADKALSAVLAGSPREEYEGVGWGPGKEPRWYHCVMGPMTEGGEITGAVLVSMDETPRRRMEDALRQTQKLESLGVLAGGIAHDFNNLLTAMMGNLNLAQSGLPESSPAHPLLEAVENTVLKASELTRQMLAYSGKGRFSVKPRDLNAVVSDMVHLLKTTLNKKATLRVHLQEGLPAIEGDAAQLQQVVMNLVTNASDALGDREGVIRLETMSERLDAERIRAEFPAQPLEPGTYVVLEVEDTGCGMTEEVKSRIFDPFFTTKVQGRGLGLSAMLGILKGHRAGIRIRTEPGQGSLFRLYFPASASPVPSAAEPRRDSGGEFQGRALLVDDEDIILESTGAALEAMGFEVVQARDGQEALEAFAAPGAEWALVLMDLTMPRMDGATAFAHMRALKPEVPVILSSGYDRQALEGAQPEAFVQKPYRLRELAQLIRGVLGARPGPPPRRP